MRTGTPIKNNRANANRDTHQEFKLGQTGTPIKNEKRWVSQTHASPNSRGSFLNCGEKIKNPGTMESRKAAREWAPGCRGRFAWGGWRSGIPGFGPSWFPGESNPSWGTHQNPSWDTHQNQGKPGKPNREGSMSGHPPNANRDTHQKQQGKCEPGHPSGIQTWTNRDTHQKRKTVGVPNSRVPKLTRELLELR